MMWKGTRDSSIPHLKINKLYQNFPAVTNIKFPDAVTNTASSVAVLETSLDYCQLVAIIWTKSGRN
jgi:hypothetical protein